MSTLSRTTGSTIPLADAAGPLYERIKNWVRQRIGSGEWPVHHKLPSEHELARIRRAARELTHGLLIFPEGHRTKDGQVGRFRTAGLEAMLRERRLPVYVVINDGMWKARRFTDALFAAHLMDGWSEVVGRFDPPENDAEIPAFIQHIRGVIVERLAAHRAGS